MAQCYGPFNFTSNQAQVEIIDLDITKTTCPYALKGRDICYTVIVSNNSDVDMFGILFSDELDENLTYVPGSFEVDGDPQTPMMFENIIQYPLDVQAGGYMTIKFCVKINI
ncbi:MAG: DUF11 domain-containing protein [Firmicutes bacterium]|nr:DUF11 domain-containing protein [Bacillota bacterium]